ncbi:MAG: hypothetical protein JNK18_03070 [Cyclobacteriaceae bacterium]|jgi:hypothetical protein|nr:hypothetical protein [Cyclobacteriaceae bacterium]
MHGSPLFPGTDFSATLSTESIITYLHSVRNKRLAELSRHDDALMDLLEELYNTVAISPVKREFMKRDLAELRSSSLDLAHYSSLITEIKKTGNPELAQSSPLFTEEMKQIFRKYGL